MKRILLILHVCLIANISFGQLAFKNSNNGRMMDITDLDGRSLLKNYDPDITGSAFIMPDWMPAKITRSNGKIIEPIAAKLNIEANELYLRDSAGKEIVAANGQVRKIEFYDFSKDKIQLVFKNGYPAIDKQDEHYYYQLFTEGKIELLGKKSKYIRTTKNEFSGEITKEFLESALTLYVFADSSLQLFRPNKSFVMLLLKDKEEAITKFIDTEKINLKKTPDLIRLFSYYNGLQ